MKSLRLVLAGSAIVIALIALFIWHIRKPSLIPSKPNQPPTSFVHTNTRLGGATARGARGLSTSVLQNAMMKGLAALNDIPIIFYGRLEDQFGNPVAGAEITGHTIIYSGSRPGSETLSTTSDAVGSFLLKAGNGESLGLVPRKEGYVLATTSTYFKYSYMYPDHFVPNPNNPTVIKMWKLEGAQPLITIRKKYKLPYTDAAINFDLVSGNIVASGGDIQIKIIRPIGIISEHNPQNWGFKIEAVEGGLIETTSQEASVTYAAPESGYLSSDALAASSNHHGVGLIQQEFFIQSRNRQVYTKLGISFRINDTPSSLMSITFDGAANANGSRNWEATASTQ